MALCSCHTHWLPYHVLEALIFIAFLAEGEKKKTQKKFGYTLRPVDAQTFDAVGIWHLWSNFSVKNVIEQARRSYEESKSTQPLIILICMLGEFSCEGRRQQV